MLVYVTNLGGEGGKLSFQCLRPSASLRAAGKKFNRTLISHHLRQWDTKFREFFPHP
jgi:hypothetical protein